MKISHNEDAHGLKYITAVRIAFEGNEKKYSEFLKVVQDCLHIRRSDPFYDKLLNRVKARVKEVLKGHTDLILGFNIFMPKEYQIPLPLQLHITGKKMKVEENSELPWDVLDIISKTLLDFGDHFEFAGVCKSWRAFHKKYWRSFLASQEPLLIQLKFYGNESVSFISISDQKIYCSENINNFFLLRNSYVTSSSGYFIIARNNSFMLFNPFTRIKKEIDTSTCDANSFIFGNHALLAFSKYSQEFLLVNLCKHVMSLHVYQSRNCGWVTYSTMENLGKVVDFVVLHNMIYVVTDKANIGVLNLNSANIKFLKLKSTPNEFFGLNLRLVNCDEQLLVVDILGMEIKNVYKIDFSTMNYVKLKTLGDIALFYVVRNHCYALSNPKIWGYESNFVYVVDLKTTKYSVYLANDKKLENNIMLPGPIGRKTFMRDWYFKNLLYEVDYSLVE